MRKLFSTLLMIGIASSANAQNLVTNGSFETPAAPLEPGWISINSGNSFLGWTVSGNNAVDIHAGEHGVPWSNVPNGVQALDLNGGDAAGIYQDIATVSGNTYKLQFHLSANPACSPAIVQAQVLFDGEIVDEPIFNTAGNTVENMQWDAHDYTVTATSNLSRLEFISKTVGTSCGPAIDAVELTPVVNTVSVGGTITGMNTAKGGVINCLNLKTKQNVKIIIPKGTDIRSWDCSSHGLKVNPGDKVKQTVTITGTAD